MVINVHGGHNAKAPGASGLLNEVAEDRKVKDLVIAKLRALGHTAYDCTDDDGATANACLKNIVARCNSHGADLDVSIHFNAAANDPAGDGRTTGTEVLVYSASSAAAPYAANICAAIAALGFRNRGVKERPGLYVLKHTRAPALLVECCFVDDADDAALYNAEAMAAAIVQGITGQAVPAAPAEQPETPAQPEQPSGYPAQFQIWLNANYAAGLTVDGLWGPKTKAGAVQALQTELNGQFNAGLEVDGTFGPKTKAACVNVRQGARGNLTRIIQGTLYCLGYDPQSFDGFFDDRCADAVRCFQTSHCLKVDGVVGVDSWTTMLG